MESLDHRAEPIGGPYVEEIFLEACNLQWKCIELRCQRLQKMRQHIRLTHQMELEELRYNRQLRRFKHKKEARQEKKRQEEETRRRREEEMRRRQWEKERVEPKKQKKEKKKEVSDMQMDEDGPLPRKKAATKTKSKVSKTKMQLKQVKKTKPKRIVPTTLPSTRPEDDEAGTEEKEDQLGGHESSPSELPDDGLLDLLSLDKASDSDIDHEPSMVSLILPVAQDLPKPVPVEKKKSTPQKRFANKRGGIPVDFDFTNAEAKRQAKAAEAARGKQYECDEDDPEPEPVPAPSIPIPKKRLKRRKEAAKGSQRANGVNTSGGKTLMAAMADTTIAIKPKNGVTSDESTMRTNGMRKKTTENDTVSKGALTKTKLKNAQSSAEVEGKTPDVSSKVIKNGKTETMSIKQRLANVELLAQMNKMQDMNTPKVLSKKTKKTEKQEAGKTLAAKRAEMRKMLSSGTEEADARQPDQMIEEEDLNISLNSSGLMSDNDSPENLRALTRKRARVVVQGDVTPTKKLQFFEITKRLAKSPMPRFLRTPTPLTSPAVPSARVNLRAASPAPRAASARNTAPNEYEERRMKSAPVRPKKTINANRFGVPIGGANVGAGGGSFSMFDAFVNSGSNGAIPRLRKKA
ncbi:unnamed protein product [Peronospora farinosa]|uniref:Uncharacterized protein n=1 Tax=Peronospora farinosa TaxID=134698 RepID=A0AAV0TCZ5_9STRA|nr:unnamed protein product [Peronospora farinosa]CAI5719768.1 unnamed protein product [Peronospora farinosa]